MAKIPKNDAQIIEPKIRYRDQIQVDHHLFKGLVGVALKRDKFGPIPIKSIEHVHYFHSVNSQGNPQRFCNAVCGHVHEWSWEVNPATGELEAKCGPPLKKVVRPLKNGTTKVTYEKITLMDDDKNIIPDNHTHDLEYIASTRISQANIKSIQQSNAAVIGSPSVKIHDEPKAPEGFEMRASDSSRLVD